MHSVLIAIPILLFQFDECRFRSPRDAVLDADAVRIHVSAGAGNLRVEGKPDLQLARIRGTACASDRSLLDHIKLLARRIGNELRINAHDEPSELRSRDYARLNIVIEVPEHMAATIQDDAGDIELRGLGVLDVRDGACLPTASHHVPGSASSASGAGPAFQAPRSARRQNVLSPAAIARPSTTPQPTRPAAPSARVSARVTSAAPVNEPMNAAMIEPMIGTEKQ